MRIILYSLDPNSHLMDDPFLKLSALKLFERCLFMRSFPFAALAIISSFFLFVPDASASSQRPGYYTSIQIGIAANSQADLKFTDGTRGTSDIDPGMVVSGAFGYRFFPWLRAEGELGYFDGEFDKSSSSSMDVMTYMANVYLDWQNNSGFTPYVGVGLGLAYLSVDVSESFVDSGTTYTWVSNDSDNAFAWQAGLGVSYEVQNRLMADLGWRYIDTGEIKLNTTLLGSAVPVKTNFSSNLIRLGMRYEF